MGPSLWVPRTRKEKLTKDGYYLELPSDEENNEKSGSASKSIVETMLTGCFERKLLIKKSVVDGVSRPEQLLLEDGKGRAD